MTKLVQKRRLRLGKSTRTTNIRSAINRLEKERDAWQEKAEDLGASDRSLREQLDLRRLHQAQDTWFWQGEGDDLDSMSNSMAVVIRADQLRALLASNEPELLITSDDPELWISEKNLLTLKNKGMAYATGFDTGGQIPFYRHPQPAARTPIGYIDRKDLSRLSNYKATIWPCTNEIDAVAVYTSPKSLPKDDLRDKALEYGFKLKLQADGTYDLNDYVYAFADYLLSL